MLIQKLFTHCRGGLAIVHIAKCDHHAKQLGGVLMMMSGLRSCITSQHSFCPIWPVR